MARTLASLKQRNDYNGRQIRCLIVEDMKTGLLSKVREPELFDETIEATPSPLLTMVFEPTEMDRNKLLKLIGDNVKTVNGETVSELTDEVVLLKLLEMTDLDMNPEQLKANKALMKEILEKPSALFISIKNELDMILLEIVTAFEEVVSAYQHMPSDMLDAQNKLLSMKEEQAKNNEKIEQRKKEIDELKKKLAELEEVTDGHVS